MVLLQLFKIVSREQALKGVKVERQNRTIGVVFSYEEMNTNVLLNATLRNQKKNNSIKIIAYVPTGFSYLFFSADEIVEIPKYLNNFTNYSKASEYFPQQSNALRSRIWNKLKYKFLPIYLNFLVRIRISDQRLVFALKLFPTNRQIYFLYESGVWDWVLSDFKKRVIKKERWVIFPVTDYLSFRSSRLEMKVSTLAESFQYLFSELYFAISDGITEEFREKIQGATAVNSTSGGAGFEDSQIFQSNTVYLRTRNYKNKQRSHNTTKNDVSKVVDKLLDSDVNVINIGSPVLSLKDDLESDNFRNYRELSSVLTIDDEIKMLNGPILCRADAGLFVLVACLPVPIFCLSPEWSESFGIRLMDARSKFGIKRDLDFLPTNSEKEIVIHALRVLGQKRPSP